MEQAFKEYRKMRYDMKEQAAKEINELSRKFGVKLMPVVTIKGANIESEVVIVEDPAWRPEPNSSED
jgi:hypothetical protein